VTDIVFPSNTREIINGIRVAIGRPITFVIVASSIPCPVCNLDPITNESDNSFCQICDGTYWIPDYDEVVVSAHVNWGQTDDHNWQTGGMIYDGSMNAQIELTDANDILADTAVCVLIDDKEFEIKRKMLRGVKELNRILLSLIESEQTA